MYNQTYSMPCVGFGASTFCRGGDEGIVASSTIGVWFGVGDCWTSICEKNVCLCGSGDMSIMSCIGPGEDDGNGGVVTKSVMY